MIPVGQVLGWIVNLAVAELLIRRRRRSGTVLLPSYGGGKPDTREAPPP
ncbi:hypothetical protein [Streptomyces sp. NPDC004134]